MKVLALAASLSIASASLLPRQGIQDIPQCALSCALGGIQSTGCDVSNFACICQATEFITALLPCVQQGCSEQEIQDTITAASGLCAAAGVTLSVPPLASETGASTSAPATTSGPAPTTEATMTEATTEATTSAPGTETTAPTSAEETTSMPATTAGGNGTQTGTQPPTPTGTEPGAAGRNTVALGSLGAIVALVAAFL